MSNEVRRVNRLVAAQASIFFLNPAHLKPLAISIIFGLVVGQGFELGPWVTFLLVAWPFATWLIVIGKDPRPYLAQWHRNAPKWRRHKVLHNNPFHKKKIGAIRVRHR